ncbi:hypothetical protein TVAG_413180 [Trichomonas vaginalis G3]|uniref:C2 NT-type domain-containing protein n=1 Tax=Trichomonas vaginalis (strain ATCC PRA-98 / G3) TaxID=412133 RepID=A2FY71_TRIV3|nr:N-terminal C2 in EEIG1 and EHBP1 proteins family [Trichomonas vaginalis G3]EAX90149.1 hypothetical protein TVAG_413180 [Trichomonas vaginalis G3]KAI5550117.1 N-terminal C2 in EEIG1 and EHBP1 proteins family [Trichomonas vaginalis G3]|eukprot:XP_001303079.1 hypothetical protein [Trichomonas vaginalis G3]
MFSFHYNKLPNSLVFTVHSLILPEEYNESFQVKWQRGDKYGETNMIFPAKDNVVPFEKRFMVNATMYVSKKDGQVREKLITFKVWRIFPDSTEKLFGKITINFSKFYGITNPMAGTFTLESPHRKKSQIVITFRLMQVQKGMTDMSGHALSDASLTTISETMSLKTDNTNVWDVSEVVNNDDKHILEDFMATQHRDKTKESDSGLSAFAIQSKERVQTRMRHGSVIHRNHMPPKNKVPEKSVDILSDYLKSKQTSEPKKDSEEPSHLEPDSINTTTKVYLTMPASRNLMRAALSHTWHESPIKEAPFPKISAVLYSTIEASQILEKLPFSENGYTSFTKRFIELIEDGIIIKNSTKLDLFVAIVHLAALLPKISDALPNRLFDFTARLNELAERLLLMEADKQSEILSSVATSLENTPELFETVVQSFSEGYAQLKARGNAFSDLVSNYSVKQFDKKLALKIINNPAVCTFKNAISWSSFCTRIFEENNIELPFLKEVSQVLMMSSSLCDDPKIHRDIAPDLSLACVFELLKNQRSDEFMPIINDTKKFEQMYETEVKDLLDLRICFSAKSLVEKINTEGWERQTVTVDESVEFPFTRVHFNVE